ncbi:MAG: ATP-dependent RNA helicase HrpA [Xanthomonadales bacterium]|nr:ATP-dependent RNA helicase HrpA [Xanthomonadales bacterium]
MSQGKVNRSHEVDRRSRSVDLRGVATRDYARLRRLRQRWAEQGDEEGRLRLLDEIAASRASVDQRASRMPTVRFPDDLPVSREAERLVEMVRRHQVLVVAGETGSGKTTQLPKICLAAGRGAAGLIGCTQPRRIAARSVARRVAQELQVELGGLVGYQVRFTEQVRDETAIKFMTDGILLAEIQSDRFLSRYDTLILDEAHERSLNIDFLLGYLKTLLKRRRDLKLIVTSATIDTARFAKHFDDAPVVEVEGRSYPVEVRYRPPHALTGVEDESGEAVREPRSPAESIVSVVDEITAEDPLGDVLVFLPGEREIHELHRLLGRRHYRETEVLPLYARLSTGDQDRIFRPGPKRRIVLATNVAETSLTVPRIRYVVDPGLARVKRYSPRQKLDRLHIEPISRASADQRKGRCGRVAAGVCYRLYEQGDYESRPPFTDPEIRRSALAGVILRMLSLGLGEVDRFPFIDAPDARAVSEGWQQLLELGAVDTARKLSSVGREMARWPVDVKLSRMLIAARELDCLREVLTIVAFLSIQDPRERPVDARAAADTAHAAWADPKSEFVGILNLWAVYQQEHEARTQSKLREWCGKQFLSYLRMREWRELHRQLLLLAGEAGWKINTQVAEYGALHRALIVGMPMQVGRKQEKHLFEAPRQRKFALFPGSHLAKQPPNWVLSAVLLDTQKVYALTNARIEPEWVIEQAAHLVARKHFDPHWSRAQGRVIGSEQISLFGLVLAPKRPIHYGSLYPAEARELFVRQGLVPGEINTRAAFLERNLATLAKATEEEAKLRRAGLVADDEWQAAWYLDRIPEDVCTAAALDSWYRKLAKPKQDLLQWSLEELLPGEGSEADRFPKWWKLGSARLALHYRFEPGTADDGVTLVVPLHLLNALDEARMSWLVPGFVEERATELIRGLPKALRRNFVPAPDFARAFVEACAGPTGDALEGELARFLKRATGADILPADFSAEQLPVHLRMNLRLLAKDGKSVLADSRSLEQLRKEFGSRAQRAFADRAAREWSQEDLDAFPDEVPVQIEGDAGVPAFPCLIEHQGRVALGVLAERSEACRAHARGVDALLHRGLADRFRQSRKQLPIDPKLGLLYAAIETQERLRDDLVEAAYAELRDREALERIRSADDFAALLQRVGRGLFQVATERLRLAEEILQLCAGLKPKLQPPLMGFGKANFDDLAAQYARLICPGFLRETPSDKLRHLPRFLRGMHLRAERLVKDPARDQQRMLELLPFESALAGAEADRPAAQELRWALEEFRISLFAQDLGTSEPVSAKRLGKLVEALGA